MNKSIKKSIIFNCIQKTESSINVFERIVEFGLLNFQIT